MNKNQKIHKKLIKFQNKLGKVEGKKVWRQLKRVKEIAPQS